jgi:multiple sugar transport system ATP-binding protein
VADLELRSIRKAYGPVEVIREVTMHIADGEFCVFVGPSGCGKSTLLRMIAGLEDISGGELHIGGRLVNEVAPAQRGVAMVFQSYALFPHLTVRQNMSFGLELARRPAAEIERRVGDAARLLQLEHLMDRKPKALSGGQRQRVAIGRAIVREPGVFLFDEPLSNLDAALRVQTRLEIARLHREHGRASTVYVTHDQVEAMTLADRILLLHAGDDVARHGSIAQLGTPLELYHRPKSRFVAGFIGSPKMNFAPATLEQGDRARARVRLATGEQLEACVDASALPAGAPLTIGLRPEHATLGTAMQHLVRDVKWQERLGDSTYLYLDGGNDTPLWTVRAPGAASAQRGQRVAFGLPAAALHVFDEHGQALVRSVPDDELPLANAA